MGGEFCKSARLEVGKLDFSALSRVVTWLSDTEQTATGRQCDYKLLVVKQVGTERRLISLAARFRCAPDLSLLSVPRHRHEKNQPLPSYSLPGMWKQNTHKLQRHSNKRRTEGRADWSRTSSKALTLGKTRGGGANKQPEGKKNTTLKW